jgi:hypothetical protein
LGRSNSATSQSTLTNSAGTALSLNSKAGTPTLTVGNSVQVPNLNASLLGGKAAAAFLSSSPGSVGSANLAAGEVGPPNSLGTSCRGSTAMFLT